MMNAQAANVPVLLVTGEVPQQFFGKGYLQEGVDARLNIDAIYENALEYSAMVTNQNNFQTIMQQALRDARSLPERATHISLPNDVAGTAMQVMVNPGSGAIRTGCASPGPSTSTAPRPAARTTPRSRSRSPSCSTPSVRSSSSATARGGRCRTMPAARR